MNGDRIVKLSGNLELLEFASGANAVHAQSTFSARTRNSLLENTITGLVLDPSAAAPERSPVRMSANVRWQGLAAAALLVSPTVTAFRIHRR